jgi:hypothetical protein
VARTAVIAGTATHVSNNVSRRQANRWSQQQEQEAYQAAPAPMPAEPAPVPVDPIARLRELGELHEQGILTDEEFAREKAKALG